MRAICQCPPGSSGCLSALWGFRFNHLTAWRHLLCFDGVAGDRPALCLDGQGSKSSGGLTHRDMLTNGTKDHGFFSDPVGPWMGQ